MDQALAPGRPQLPLLLAAAVLQGCALYGLHFAMQQMLWPATDSRWLFGLYALWIFTPLTVQILAAHAPTHLTWRLSAALALAFFGFGWQLGRTIPPEATGFRTPDAFLPAGITFAVLWLMLMPFVQGRLARGTWRCAYRDYFESAWHNKLLLAEAALFTGVFWILLALWGGLFRLLDIDFFRDLFTAPAFIYPVTAVAFGIALYLIGSLHRLVATVLEQLLGLLKWLGVMAGLILILFTLSMLPALPRLVAEGQSAIDARWLLWLLAVTILLLNASYRDGSVHAPYPRALGIAMRCAVPFMVIVALTAVYALCLRIVGHGFTVARAWGLLVALATLAYSAGYAWAAMRKGPWMAGMGRVNIIVALGLILVLGLTLTPVLSPYRIAAASQYQRALETVPASVAGTGQQDALGYLRFSAGSYGLARLHRLEEITDHPRATQLRDDARRLLSMQARGIPGATTGAEVLDSLPVFPRGSSLDDELRAALAAPPPASGRILGFCAASGMSCAGLFTDLNGDGEDEFLMLTPYASQVYRRDSTGWLPAGNGQTLVGPGATWEQALRALEDGDYETQVPVWLDLRIGERTIELQGASPPGAVPAAALAPVVPAP